MFGEAFCAWKTAVVFYYFKFRLSVWLFTYREKWPSFHAVSKASCGLMPKKAQALLFLDPLI